MSKRITKAMAEAAAHELAKRVYDEKVQKAADALRKMVKEMYEKYVPSPVRQCAVEYAKYYTMYRNYISFVTEACDGGRNYKSLDIGFAIPDLTAIVLSAEDWKCLDKTEKEYYEIKRERSNYEFEVAEALFGLRTPKRVEEMFPEALPYMNFADTTAISVDLMKLRSVLNA